MTKQWGYIYIYIYTHTHTLACNLCSTHDLLNVINIIFLLKKKDEVHWIKVV